MKKIRKHLSALVGVGGTSAAVIAITFTALSQTVPVLTMAPLGTNQFSITITNAVPTYSYELWWTPVLNDPVDYPWTAAAQRASIAPAVRPTCDTDHAAPPPRRGTGVDYTRFARWLPLDASTGPRVLA